MTETIDLFSGQIYEIAADATKPLVIENFDPTQDAIQLPKNPDSEVIPQFSFSDRYTLTEIDGDTAISTLTGQLLAVVKDVTGLKTFTGYTKEDTYSLVSLENDFFSTYIEPNFYEPWYVEFDKSDYGNSVQKAIDTGLVSSAYEHYLKFGQFEAREDIIFAPKTDGNNTIYGSGYEGGLVGVPISEGVYTRDVKPITTGIGEIDTLIGAPGEDSFFLGNGTVLNEASQPFYVGGGDDDYALIKNLDNGSSFGQLLDEVSGLRESLTDRIVLAGKAYDYEFEKVDGDLKISYQGDLVAIIEDAPPLDVPFSIPGATYLYTTGNEATFDSGDGFGSADRFYEPFYLEEYPEVQAAIDQGEYKSAFEHYIKVGQSNPEGEAIFAGTSGDDFIAGFGSNDLLIGVELTFVDGEKEGYRTASTGVGEEDNVVGGLGVSTYVIGNDNILDPEKGGEVWYVGNGDEDYLTIEGFDPYKDFLFGAGEFADYSFEVIEETDNIFGRLVPYKSLEVNYQSDRVALLKYIDGSLTLPDITSLIAFPLGDERPNALALVAPQNEFLPEEPPAGSEYFNAEVYAAFNPDIFEFIGEGKPYKDVLDYYVQEGQFREDGGGHGFFVGTSSNDVLQGFGFDKDLYGVSVSVSGSIDTIITLTPETLGVGEIDTMIGSAGIDGFYAGLFTKIDYSNFTGESVPFYIGEGDGDYLLVKDFDSAKDYLALSGQPADYIYKVEQDDFKIYTQEGDLVAIVEDNTDLKVENIFDTFNLFTFEGDDSGQGLGFDEEVYLGIYPEVAQLVAKGQFSSALEHYQKVGQYEEGGTVYTGTSGNDTVISWTHNAEVRLSGVDFVTAEPAGFEEGQNYFGVKPATYGVGEIDTLILSADTGTVSEALLGFFRAADGSLQRFYVGEGENDYAVVKNFNKNDKDEIFLAGVPEDYTYKDLDGNLHIAYQGDLVGIVEGVKLDELELADEGEDSGAFVLVGNPNSPDLYFNESVYLTLHPKVRELIDNGEYASAYAYYLEVGQEKGQRAFFSGTPDGNDNITAIGDSATLFGVEVTGYDKENQQFIIPDDGAGQIDSLTGNEGRNRFVLGNNEQSFYVGNGDEDYANIYDFDRLIDSIILAGDLGDYQVDRLETEEGNKNLEISTKDGDLVAIIHDVGDLILATRPVDPERFSGDSVIVSTDHQILQNELADNFFEPYYAFNNPQAVEAVANGEYDSVYDYYLEVGRFTEEGIQFTYWEGTSGNDLVTGIGDDIGLFGVDVTTIERQALVPHGIIGIETEDTGVGTVDILIGQAGGGETVYNLGKTGLSSAPNPTPFYVGEGDADYALIKNFDPLAEEQFLSLVGTPSDYTIIQQDGNTRISYHDDLIAIVEGTPNLSVLPFFSRDGRFFLASLDAEGFADSTEFNFYENLYLQSNPDVVEAIANREYESAFDHYAKVGRLEGREGVIFNGAGIFGGNDIVTDLGGDGEAVLIGVPITKIEVEGDNFAFDTANNGEGQKDTLIGTEATELFVLGKNGSLANPNPTSLYIGNGNSDYAAVWSFDETKDRIFLAGDYEDYTYETIDGDLEISKDGDLVAVVDGITELEPYKGANPEGGTYLLSLENNFFSTYVEPYFFAPIYAAQNPDVDALIAAGEYTSYYDHFLRAGQFEQREDTFFAATEGNDTMYAIGWESILSGVPITAAQYEGGLDIVPTNLGTGQIDILNGNGSTGKETIFMLGNTNILNDTAQSFYLGNGDTDYALIKNFSPGDRIFLGSDIAEFTQTVVDGNLQIAKDGDLIAIIENRTELTFDRDNELTSLATESYASGTEGNDTVFGSNRQSSVIGVPLANKGAGEVYATTTGAGEFDILNGSKRGDTFFLGIATTPDGTPQPLYVGNGDADYALIQDFSTKELYDSVTLAGKVSDYNFEFEAYEGIGDDTKIYTKDGDLIGIVEDVTLSQFYVEGSGITLYASSLNGTAEEASEYLFDIEPFFYEDFYLAKNPEVADLITSGEYGTAFEHYLEVGQYAEEGEVIFSGTEGDDLIPSIGKSDLVFGVPLTTVDGVIEGWEEASTGVGEQDTLGGGLGVTTFFIGNDQLLDPSKPNSVYYVGEGDADYALIQGFQPTQDIIFGAGSIDEYNFETVDGDLKISYGSDLVAIVDDAGDLILQELPIGEARPRGLALVAPENQFLQGMG
jgi:hypothetical protein